MEGEVVRVAEGSATTRARGHPAWRAAVGGFLVVMVLAATARAQPPPADTEFTPVAKEAGEEWAYVGGGEFGSQALPAASATPLSVDFYGVDFVNETDGVFVGSQCIVVEAAFEEIEDCDRAPAIYTHSVPPGQPAEVRQALGPEATGESETGYVASVAWISPGKAVAVGGTGHYPRRELDRRAGESDAEYANRDLAGEEPNAAGRARAWILDRGHFGDSDWHEVDDIPLDADGTPARGLTAIDCSPRLGADGSLCIAGGFRQLWVIRDGEFVQSFTPSSQDATGKPTVEYGSEWRFRVRSIRFRPGASVAGGPHAIAVTAGCCAEHEAANAPRVLIYDGEKWYARLLAYSDSGAPRNGLVDNAAEKLTGRRPTAELDSAQRTVRARQSLPDSYFALNSEGNTLIATPGGSAPDEPNPAAEPVSRLIKINPQLPDVDQKLADIPKQLLSLTVPCLNSDPTGDLCGEAANPKIADLRLVAGDGDYDRPRPATVLAGSGAASPDGLMDWAVGSLANSGPGHADRAAAYTTLRAGNLTPNPLECTLFEVAIDCGAREVDEVVAETQSQSVYALPTYSLNAFSFTPGGGVGWAAGDKGALLRLGGEGTVASQSSEPAPPKLGAARTERAPEADAYDDARPSPAGQVGEVPALSNQPTQSLESPELIPTGTANANAAPGASLDSVRSIVMSRDGSEGWALGGRAGPGTQGTVFHYDGQRWSRCETSGVPGQTQPDRACKGLAPLHGTPPVQIMAAVRIPLERDSDPTNDEEFEAIAVGTKYTSPDDKRQRRVVLRYRQGEWSMDESAMRQIDPAGTPVRSPYFSGVAFTSPDDGWILAANESGAAGMELFHFDGIKWSSCAASAVARQACGDFDGVLPLGQEGSSETQPFLLQAVGAKLYLAGTRRSQADGTLNYFPVILSLDTAAGSWRWEQEHDPGCVNPQGGQCNSSEEQADRGRILAFSVARGPDGRYAGWAVGAFGAATLGDSDAARQLEGGRATALLRLTLGPDGQPSWQQYAADDAAADYLLSATPENGISHPPRLLITVDESGNELTLLAPARRGEHPAAHPILSFSSAAGERPAGWRVFPAPFALSALRDSHRWNALAANVQGMAPDGNGGFWLAARQAPTTGASRVFFYRYDDERPMAVFDDAPHPIREAITDAEGTLGGQLWVSTEAGLVYRYDRLTGWERMAIPGWDPGRVVTRTSRVNAIAVGLDGEGIVVGEGGRIAEIGPRGVKLDPAAGARLCAPNVAAPCGTGRELHSAAVAPDGSAMAGGEGRSLLWRPAGGEFRAIDRPLTAVSATFTGIAMPSPEQAWVSTDTGQIFAGERNGGSWSWRLENVNSVGELVNLDAGRRGIPLNAIAVGADGQGYAVGEYGLILERRGESAQPWQRVDADVREHLYSVALPVGEGSGALIGGELGLVLTLREGSLEVARPGEFTDPLTAGRSASSTARIVGLALLPGYEDGQVEAWAASQGAGTAHRDPGAGALFHYTSAPGNPLLQPQLRADPLPDAPNPSKDTLSFGVFGRSDCHLLSMSCIEPQGTNFVNEVVPRRIVSDLTAPDSAAKADFALFTGDVNRAAGRDGSRSTPLEVDVMHRRWRELIAGRFTTAGVPLFGAIGVQDLSQVKDCPPLTAGRCITSQQAGAGTTGPWQDSFAGMPEPWGDGNEASAGVLSFEAAPGQGGVADLDEATDDEPGARTHYAVDVAREGEPIARIVFLDNSMRSLSASDPQQNPIEPQTDFLRRMLCTGREECTRRLGQEAIVVFNTPTYSYEPSASSGGVETATDSAALETVLLRERANLVVSGRLGWNGLYYALAPGLHCPSPGASHPDPNKRPSEWPSGSGCDHGADDLLDPVEGAVDPSERVPLTDETPTGELPFVVASGGGGTFGPVSEPVQGSASQGFWHGYSLVHLDTETGFAGVEQRPVFDWIGIVADEHQILPRSRLVVNGYGREAASADIRLRYDRIDSHAITHRYDLLLADPDRPWLPCLASDSNCAALQAKLVSLGGDSAPHPATSARCAPYLCLPERIGQIDRTTGVVSSGGGKYPDTFGLIALSVGDRVATKSLVFRASPSFVVTPFEGPPPIVGGVTPKAPAPPPIPEPKIPSLTLPELPTLPLIAPLEAGVPTEPQPPVPPAPPPPADQPSPLSLSVAPSGLTVATPTAVLQPPTPPVNPAPPGGARREARQRQAAAQKSGADAEGAAEGSEEGIDPSSSHHKVNPVDSEHQGATRVETARDRLFFSRHDGGNPQPSAWAREALLGGGAAVSALVLALSWAAVRQLPRRREPRVSALAVERARRWNG